jgi:hypothetical protein
MRCAAGARWLSWDSDASGPQRAPRARAVTRKTGEAVKVAPKTVVKFKAAAELQKSLPKPKAAKK